MAADEFTAFKNPSAQRSEHLRRIINLMDTRILGSGTPIPNSVLDIWFPALLVDDGERLGINYYKFRN